MYGNSKLGRGGGRAVPTNKRNSYPPPPSRLSTPSSSNRLSLGANRNRTEGPGIGAPLGASKAVEETFSLVSGNNPLAFAMIIRLAPDLVEEIRRVESQGRTARIKFDALANNPSGNVIDVGGKEFRFTWSREFGDLCDIYEERQSGEDGNGSLVETGCAWRKVNVQRILDESTVNQVKMRSEEAERKLKSRKAIVLDHGNPSMKSQIKQLAAVEANPWRMQYKQKKEPPLKKRKVETLQVSGPPKSTNKAGAPTAGGLKGRRSASPLLSSPGQSGAPASPTGTGNIVKNHVSIEEVTPMQVKSKENTSNSEKEITTRTASVVRETPGSKGNSGAKPTDLKSMLITLLMENPKGMSLKALEKAVGDTSPNFVRKIEPIIKKIATLQTPGKYLLKPGVVLDSFKKPSSESGSSPEDNRQQTPAHENIHSQTTAVERSLVEKIPADDTEEQALPNSKLEESNAMEKIDDQQFSPNLFVEKKVSDNSEGQPASSSDSGSDSDSDSDSSDSGSDSGSRSRSRSPVGSGSGSSSDSESDASSNSKEGSDEDVDIMTSDDEKEDKHKLQASEPGLSTSPMPWRSDDGRPVQNVLDEKQDDDGSDTIDIEGHGSDAIEIEGHGSDAVDIEKDLPSDDQEIEMAMNTSSAPSGDAEKLVDRTKSLTDDNELQERQNFVGKLFNDKETIKDKIRHERSDGREKKSKSKSKRGHGSDAVDIEKDLPIDAQEIEMAVNTSSAPSRDAEKLVDRTKTLTDDNELQERQNFIGKLFNDKETIKDKIRHERSDGREKKSKSKSKRGPDLKRIDEISDRTKRSKVESFQPPSSGGRDSQFLESPHNFSPNRSMEDTYKASATQMMNRADREENADFGFPKGYNPEFSGKRISDFQQSGRKSFDKSARQKAHDLAERPNKYERKFSGKSSQMHDGFPVLRENASGDTQNEDSFPRETKGPRNLKEGGAGAKNSVSIDSNYGKQGETVGKFNETGQFSSSQMGNGRGPVLQRELSDLELGELREPLQEEAPFKKQFDRKGSFKQSENKSSTSDNCNSDLSKGKPIGKATLDSGKTFSPNPSGGVRSTPEHRFEDSTITHPRAVQPQKQDISRVDHAEDGSQFNRSVDAISKSGLGGDMEGYGETHKKGPANASQQHDFKRGLVSNSVKGSKTHTSTAMSDLVDGRKDTVLTESNDSGRKRRESSSDEDIFSFYKYEKDEPELKGPIKDFSQYKEYLQEYRDKYDSYLSLNKTLESYRNKFNKLGKDLEFAQGSDADRYCKLLGQLKESYSQCGTRHKRLKKIFVILHEELKHLKQMMKDFALPYTKG